MKAKDLMIGDWVECVDSTHKEKVYAQIDAIEEGQTCILVRLDNRNWFLDISFIKPIPLTPEILVKNGFEIVYDKYKLPNYRTDFYFTVFTGVDGYWNPVDLGVMIGGVPATLDYVHQLQQVLRLCGIDKEIEL